MGDLRSAGRGGQGQLLSPGRGVRRPKPVHSVYSRVWPDHTGARGDHPQFGAAGGVARRPRLSGDRRSQYLRWWRWRRAQRIAVWVVLLACILSTWSLTGCDATSRPEPGTLFQSIYNDYLQGNMEVARA